MEKYFHYSRMLEQESSNSKFALSIKIGGQRRTFIFYLSLNIITKDSIDALDAYDEATKVL